MHATENNFPADNPKDSEAMLFEIQRLSTEDGPGIRTTVFFKGCSLACTWCHNPEGLSPRPELMWYDARCIAARDCLSVCPAWLADAGKVWRRTTLSGGSRGIACVSHMGG